MKNVQNKARWLAGLISEFTLNAPGKRLGVWIPMHAASVRVVISVLQRFRPRKRKEMRIKDENIKPSQITVK